jgi:hypothetical protein
LEVSWELLSFEIANFASTSFNMTLSEPNLALCWLLQR